MSQISIYERYNSDMFQLKVSQDRAAEIKIKRNELITSIRFAHLNNPTVTDVFCACQHFEPVIINPHTECHQCVFDYVDSFLVRLNAESGLSFYISRVNHNGYSRHGHTYRLRPVIWPIQTKESDMLRHCKERIHV